MVALPSIERRYIGPDTENDPLSRIYHIMTLIAEPSLSKKEIESPNKVGNIRNEQDRSRAIDFIKKGEVVASVFRVFGLWFDANNPQAAEASCRLKGEPGKVRSLMVFLEDIWDLIDLERLHPDVRGLFESPKKLQELVGGLCFLRLPVKADRIEQVPPSVRSFDPATQSNFIHVLDPSGSMEMERFIRELNKNGVKFVGVTSMNESGEPEYIEKEQALKFMERHPEVQMLLDDNLSPDNVKGSFLIVDTVLKAAVRAGNVPIDFLNAILGLQLDEASIKQAKHPHHVDFLKATQEYTAGQNGRTAVMLRQLFLLYSRKVVQLPLDSALAEPAASSPTSEVANNPAEQKKNNT